MHLVTIQSTGVTPPPRPPPPLPSLPCCRITKEFPSPPGIPKKGKKPLGGLAASSGPVNSEELPCKSYLFGYTTVHVCALQYTIAYPCALMYIPVYYHQSCDCILIAMLHTYCQVRIKDCFGILRCACLYTPVYYCLLLCTNAHSSILSPVMWSDVLIATLHTSLTYCKVFPISRFSFYSMVLLWYKAET